MGKHSRTPHPRIRATVAAGLVGLGTLAAGGTAVAAEGSPASDGAPVAGTPCTAAARACVDLMAQKAWIIDAGKVVRGPMQITTGAVGHETPRGDFHVQWKDATHRSAEYNNAPMPNSVFFADGGIAFHEGNLNTASAGCVHLSFDDSKAVFDFLAVDDTVQVR